MSYKKRFYEIPDRYKEIFLCTRYQFGKEESNDYLYNLITIEELVRGVCASCIQGYYLRKIIGDWGKLFPNKKNGNSSWNN